MQHSVTRHASTACGLWRQPRRTRGDFPPKLTSTCHSQHVVPQMCPNTHDVHIARWPTAAWNAGSKRGNNIIRRYVLVCLLAIAIIHWNNCTCFNGEMRRDPVNRSYVFGPCESLGWGHRSLFTYYSEFDWSWGDVEATVLVVLFVLSVATNVVLGALIVRHRPLRTVTNMFVLNLAAADVLLAATVLPVAATRLSRSWLLGDAMCRLVPYCQFACGTVLLWSLALISFERYRCIVLPHSRTRLSQTHIKYIITAIWAVGCIACTPVALWFVTITVPLNSSTVTVCTLVFPNTFIRVSYIFIIATLVSTSVVPITWLTFNYVAIFRKLMANERYWKRQNLARRKLSIQFTEEFQVSFDELRHRKHCRTIKILFCDVCFTIIMWSPLVIIMGLIHLDAAKDDDYFIHSHDFIAALIVALANTIVNPVLYGMFDSNIRSRFVGTIKSISGHNNSKSGSTDKAEIVKEMDVEVASKRGSVLYANNNPQTISANEEINKTQISIRL